jgi:alpha-L-arabinofuranosidase
MLFIEPAKEVTLNRIKIDPERISGKIDRNIFGGFAEHLGRCIYDGIYEPGSTLADKDGLRKDVVDALNRLKMPIIRYPGGNFASGYRWRDGVGPVNERQPRTDLAWHNTETNRFGTNEFINFCRKLKTEPYLVVNCGDGDMREAQDWVEYCNGTGNAAPVKLRREHGFDKPYNVKYWSVGNEVDGNWQIGYKTPQEYARTFKEFGKVMKWVDPDIKLVASSVSDWGGEWAERTQLLLEQAGDLIDYLSLHWYVGNPDNNFNTYMAISELIEERLSAFEGLIRSVGLQKNIKHPVYLAVDEWNVWYRTHPQFGGDPEKTKLEEIYNLEDSLATAIQLNTFIRHAGSVKMANLAQIVNVIAPVFTRPDGLVLQTIFFPFELYSRTCGTQSLDVWWEGDTFSGGRYSGVRTLDVTATLDKVKKQIVVFTVNRSSSQEAVTQIQFTDAIFKGPVTVNTINGPDIKAENTFAKPHCITTSETSVNAKGHTLDIVLEPHSVTALIASIE